MARTLRNLQIALGVIFEDGGINAFEKKMRAVEQRLEKVDRIARGGAGLMAVAGAASSLGAALAPAAGAVVAMPAALAVMKTATATAKVALVGMGDAMSAIAEGDAAALDEALVKLSPSARKFVREADAMFGSLKSLQQSVQDRAFAGLDRELRPVADNLLPDLRTGMLDVAAGFNTGAKEAMRFAQTPMAKGAVNQTFASTSRIMGMLAGATRPAMEVITQLTVKSLPLAERMASWATNGVKAGAAFLTSERGADALERTVDRAGDTLAQMGRIGKNVIVGLVGNLSQAKGSGEGVLDTIERMTAKYAAWSKSVEGQRQAAETFTLLRDTAVAVADVLPILLGPLGALVKLINGLPEPIRDGVIQFLAFSVVVGSLTGRLRPLLTVIGGVTSAVQNADGPVQRLRDRIGGMDGAAGRARGALSGMVGFLGGPWGIALAAGVGALALFATRNGEAEQRVQDLTDALVRNKGALDGDAVAKVKNRLQTEGVLAAADKLKLSLADVADAALGNTDALARVNAGMATAKTRAKALDEQYGGGVAAATEYSHNALKVRNALEGTNGELGQAREAHRLLAATERGSVGASTQAAAGITGVGTAADKTSGKVNTLNVRLAKFRALNGDADMAAIAFRESLEDLSEAFSKNNIQIDKRTGKININNKVGREATGVLISAIQATIDHSDKVRKQTGSVDKANAVFATEIHRLRGVMEQSGLSKKAIDRLIARYATIPSQINTATGKIRDRKVLIEVKAGGKLVGFKVNVGGSSGTVLNASGGIMPDVLPGYTPGRDVHMYYSPTGGAIGLSGGEAVMRPEWTRAVGRGYVERMNAAARRGGVGGVAKAMGVAGDPGGMRIPGFASGGIIHKDSITGLSSVRAMTQKANALYGGWASQMGKAASQVYQKLLVSTGGKKAVAAARKQIGVPYSWGGGGLNGPSYGIGRGANTLGFDCSGLMRYAWYQSVKKVMPRTTYGQIPWVKKISKPQPGALGFPHSGHVFMASDKPGRIIEAPFTGARVREVGMRGASWGMPPWKFDEGGVLQPGFTPVYNGTRKPEYVFTDSQMRSMGDNHYTINVQVPVGASMAEAGRQLVGAIKEYERGNGKSWRSS